MDRSIRLPNRISTSEILYLSAFVVYMTVMILRSTVLITAIPEAAYKLVCLVCWGILAISELLKRGYNYRLFLTLALIAFFFLIIHRAVSFVTATPLLFIYCGRTYSIQRILRVTAWLTIFWLGIIVVCSQVGLIENYIMDAKYQRPREFLGFRYALYASTYLLDIITIDFYLNRERVPLWRIAFYFGAGYWLYYVTDSRLCFLFTLIMLLALIYLKLHSHVMVRPRQTLYRFLTFFVTFAWLFGMALSFFLVKIYSPKNRILAKLNNLLTGRLNFMQQSVKTYGLSLFGRRIEWVGNGLNESGMQDRGEYLYVDNLYVQFTQRYGIFFIAVILVLLTYLMFDARRRHDTHLLFVLTMLAAHAVVDDLILHIWFNPFWIMLGSVIASLTARGKEGKIKVNVPVWNTGTAG